MNLTISSENMYDLFVFIKQFIKNYYIRESSNKMQYSTSDDHRICLINNQKQI